MKIFFTLFLVVITASAAAFFFYKKDPGKSVKTIDSIEIGSTLDVEVGIERECRFGDLDIILADLQMSGPKGKNMLLSVEPIVSTGSKFKPLSVSLSAEDIEFGYKKTFELTLSGQKEHLGVFLCRDREKTGRCNKKAIFDYGKIEESLQKQGSQKVRNSDKIYFFQYLVVENKQLQFLTENIETLQKAFEAVDKITADISDDKIKNDVRKKSKNLFDSLGSYVVTKKPGKNKLYLQALLAKMDRTKCTEQKPKTPEKVRIFKGKPVSPIFKDMGFGKP